MYELHNIDQEQTDLNKWKFTHRYQIQMYVRNDQPYLKIMEALFKIYPANYTTAGQLKRRNEYIVNVYLTVE